MDAVADHIARAPKLDKRLSDAIEQHLDHDPLEADEYSEVSVEDIETWHARQRARLGIAYAVKTAGIAPGGFTKAETDGMIGAMLKRPGEAQWYLNMRRTGLNPPEALAFVLQQRKEEKARNAHNWNGGKL